MDGLLGGNQLGTLGLLGLSPEEINRARGQAQSDMYFALASQLLSGGPTGASIAKGLQMGQKAYRDALSEQTDERLQQVKIQDYLRQQQEAQAAKARQAQVDQIIGGAYQPATTEYQRMTPQQIERAAEPGFVVPQTTTPARFDLSSAAPLLMALPEGRKALTDIIGAQKAMRPETFTLAEGAMQFERDPITGQTRQIATGAQKREPIQFQDLGNVVIGIQGGKEVLRLPKGRAPEGPISFQTVDTEQGIQLLNPRTGELRPLMQGGKPVMGKAAGQLNEGQSNAVTYGIRMQQADQILRPLENAGLKDTGKIRAGVSGTLGAVPLIGDALSRGSDNIFNTLPSILGGLSEDQQAVIQARTNFITAVLRKESGASISPTEFATAEKNYFPAPGDSEKIVQQKQAAREAAIRGMKISAGPGAKFIDQGMPTAPVPPSPANTGDLASQAAAELARRRRGQ